MRSVRLLIAITLISTMMLSLANIAFARSTSLTTTIVIHVKGEPEANIAPNDKNAKMLREIAKHQPMIRPQIRNVSEDTGVYGAKVYSITDKF